MAFSIATLARWIKGVPPELICSKRVWDSGIAELRRRADGRRESGAFLLGSYENVRKVKRFVFYDDIDPNALRTGVIHIDGRTLGSLWSICRVSGYSVVADVHLHPAGFGQSESDRENPIIAEVGHIALIVPYFALRETNPEGIGVYEYIGSYRWRNRSHERPSPLHIGYWPCR